MSSIRDIDGSGAVTNGTHQAKPATAPLASAASERFARERLAGYSEQMLGTRLLVIGAGAVGAALTQQLAMWGFHCGRVVDHDAYETSNAARTLDFPWEAVHAGQTAYKAVEVAAHWRRRVAPWFDEVDVEPVLAFAQELPPSHWREADVVLAAVDHPRARYDVVAWARRYGRPVIMGGLDALSRQVNVHVFPASPDAACYACGLRGEPKYAISVASCTTTGLRAREARNVPATASLAGMCAAVMVQRLADALSSGFGAASTMTMLRIGRPEHGRLGDELELARDPECSLHDHGVSLQVSPARPALSSLARVLDTELGADLLVPGGLPVHVATDDAGELVRVVRPPWRCRLPVDSTAFEPAGAGAYPLVLDELDSDLIERYALDEIEPTALGLAPGARFPVRLRQTGEVALAEWRTDLVEHDAEAAECSTKTS